MTDTGLATTFAEVFRVSLIVSYNPEGSYLDLHFFMWS